MAVDQKAKALKAAGCDVIGFGAGEPDFPTPEVIVEAAERATRDAKNYRYTPAAGHPLLRELVATRTAKYTGVAFDASQVTITNGAKHAVFNSLAALVDPGDEVLIPAPYWVTYPQIVKWVGGNPVAVDSTQTNGFIVDVDHLEAARTERTKAMIFCSPTNPTGAVYDRDAVREIGQWALAHGIWMITDDIYQDLVYDDAEFVSVLAVTPETADHTIVIDGVSKSFAMTGWRVGWIVAPPDVSQAIGRLQGHTTSNVSNVSQIAAVAALESDPSIVETMRVVFDERRKTMYEMLSAMPGIDCVEPKGAFYAFPSVQGALGKAIAGRTATTSLELTEILLDAAGVAIVPGEAFGAPGFARLSYALSDDDLVEGLRRMEAALDGA